MLEIHASKPAQHQAGERTQSCRKKATSRTAVRYAWGDNPVCNLYSNDGLPVTPFRTDDFELITKPKPEVQPAAK